MNSLFSTLSLLIALSLLPSCTWLEGLFSRKDKSESGLSYEQAKARSAVIDNVKYDLYFELEKDEQTFGGESKISFDLNRVVKNLRVDLQGAKVYNVTVNGQETSIDYNDLYLHIESKNFKKGSNEITVKYDMRYSKFGAGFYKFTDPADNNSYVYTDFEPYDANRLFPAFDQPDLKATFTTRVKAPKNWTVVTSVRETSVKDEGSTRMWLFPESKKFSTYIYSLHAGPYHVWENLSYRYPLRLMVRKSMKDYVEKDFWFKITEQGFNYFNEYFSFEYPFLKYDQVIVPDFNSGAMENVAAVTFSEYYLRKGEYTYDDRLKIASVILHEMAHMWFGNLVTMKWWNDLWLNESFASIMAAKALDEATEFKTSWRNFYARMKQWAYWEDQLDTTHPIEAEVRNTDDAFANFDGITYGKGASVLKQIMYYLSDEKFRKGVRIYFAQHAYTNTSLGDFISALERGSEEDLSWWSKQWLQTSGVNTVSVNFSCDRGKIKTAEIQQLSKLRTPGLRKHKTKIALLYADDNQLQVGQTVDVIYEHKNTKIEQIIGQKCPAAMYPNYDDNDYVLVDLDEKSQASFSEKLTSVKDDLLRMMVWRNQWDMVLDQKLPIQKYLDLVTKNLENEREIDVLKMVLGSLVSTRHRYSPSMSYLPHEGENESKYAATMQKKIEEIMWRNLNASLKENDKHILWFESFVAFAQTEEGLANLAAVYNDRSTYEVIHKNQDYRWRILWQLGTYSKIDIHALIAAEAAADKSDSALNWQLGIEIARNDQNVKETFYKRLIDAKNEDSAAKQKVIAANLFPAGQDYLRLAYAERYFKDLPQLAKIRNDIFLDAYSEELIPLNCGAKGHTAVKRFVENNSTLKENVLRGIKKHLEDDARCIKIREYANRYNQQAKQM